jgi:hypothetical protein
VASFHASTNAFDNEILRTVARKTTLYAGGTALVLGVGLGMAGYWLLTKRGRKPA